MNLLCCHLNRLGYEAYVVRRRGHGKAPVPVRYLGRVATYHHTWWDHERIVVYSEVTVGNPRRARFVVRYLLNSPGYIKPGAELSHGKEDYFLAGAPEHAPAGVRSFDLFMPLVDRSFYFPPPPPGSPRDGFVVFTNRATVDPSSLPEWLSPYTLTSMQAPRSHAELGELYRHSRALVIFERSSAIFEALSCGCPVICISNHRDKFREDTYQPRFRDAGLIWGWRPQDLEAAADKTARFRAIYRDLENSLDQRIQSAFDWIIDDVWRRIGARPSSPS